MDSSELPPAAPVFRRDPSNIMTAEALRHIQPHPGGTWCCSSTHPDGFVVAYATPGRPHDSLYFVMHTCPDVQKLREFCRHHIYQPSPRPIVVRQPELPTASFDLPLRPQAPITGPGDQENGSLGSHQFAPVPAIQSDEIMPQVGTITEAVSPVELEVHVPNFGSFQETNFPAPADNQHDFIPRQAAVNIDWAIPGTFIHEDTDTLSPEHKSMGDSSQALQPENDLSAASWGQNWNQMTGMGENVDQQAWDPVFPSP